MGTWKLTNFTNARIVELGNSWWVRSAGPSSPFNLDCQPVNFPDDISVWGEVLVNLGNNYAQLYLDGSPTPVDLDDLPDNFGIESITYQNTPLWLKNGVSTFVPNFPIAADDNNSNVFSGAGAAYWWTIQPIGLHEYQTIDGSSGSTLTFVDPYLGVGYPPVMTKWNGFLQAFLQQGSFTINFSRMSGLAGAYLLFVFLNYATINDEGFVTGYTSFPWEINGTYDVYEPPPNPTVYPLGGMAFGGAPIIQALTDASGIYTLIPNQYHDELYQRVGTTASTLNVMIPEPFFKTGYTGD